MILLVFEFINNVVGGQEGRLLTSQVLRERLFKEAETNPSIQINAVGDAFQVKGRGELQMGVLIET